MTRVYPLCVREVRQGVHPPSVKGTKVELGETDRPLVSPVGEADETDTLVKVDTTGVKRADRDVPPATKPTTTVTISFRKLHNVPCVITRPPGGVDIASQAHRPGVYPAGVYPDSYDGARVVATTTWDGPAVKLPTLEVG